MISIKAAITGCFYAFIIYLCTPNHTFTHKKTTHFHAKPPTSSPHSRTPGEHYLRPWCACNQTVARPMGIAYGLYGNALPRCSCHLLAYLPIPSARKGSTTRPYCYHFRRLIGYRGVTNAHGMGLNFYHARLLFAHCYAYTRGYHALRSPLHRRKNIGTRHRRRRTWRGRSHAHGVYWVARRLGKE